MRENIPERRLATVMAADMAGYARLMETDEVGILDRQRTHRRELIDPMIEKYRGKIVKTTGDGMLIQFDTAQEAVQCGVAIQTEMASRESHVPRKERIRYRVGINIGDIIFDEGDIHGDGVNIAARLEALAEPGGICIADGVHQISRNQIDASFRDFGIQKVKNISSPIHVWRWSPASLVPDASESASPEGLEQEINYCTSKDAPIRRNRLIGRAEQLTAVRALLLREDVGLVTLTGPGGSGKTRLALEVASVMAQDADRQVCYVELASIRDPALVPSKISEALGLYQAGKRPQLEVLKDYLRNRRMILVLDNFEQILSAATDIAELLAACAPIKLLITSRESLRIRDEFEFPVPPLALPAPTDRHAAERLRDCPSVRLLVERAALVRPGFALDDDNAAALAEICSRLDGLPLALELAAARLRTLDPASMLARLDHRLPLLVSGTRDSPRRQRTLRATIKWSYDLLQLNERRLFEAMSIFVGGCSMSAIEAVCTAPDDPGGDLLDGIDSLIAKSLLLHVESSDGAPRFLLLETLREYGLERLDVLGRREQLARRHAEYFQEFVKDADAGLRNADQIRWLNRLEADHGNLRAALAWSVAPGGNADLGLRIAANLSWFWRMRGYNVEGSGWLEALLAAYPRRTLIRAKALWGLVMLISGDNPRQSRAIHLAKEAVSIARDFDDNVMIAWCLHALGRAQHTEKNFGPASSAFSESLERFEREGDDVGCAYSGWLLGVIARDSGDFEQAWLLFDAALRNAKRSEDPWSIAATILQTGVLAMAQKNFELAAEYLKESLVVFRKMNGRWGMLLSITRLMMVSARQGNAMRAVKLGGVAASLRQSVGADIGWGYRAEYEKDLDIAHTMLGDEAFSTAFEAGRNMEMDAALDYALSSEDESVEAASPFGTSL